MMRLGLWLSTLGFAVLASAGIGTKRTPAPIGPHPGRPECPHDWDFKGEQLSLIGTNISVPEFHDCQRFIVYINGRPVYDSLYAVFAAAGLDTLDTTLALLDSLHTGHVALAAAEVYAEGRYEALGIHSMFSCLYVYRPGGAWQAKMVAVGSAEKDCSQRVDPSSMPGKVLRVFRHQVKDLFEQDVPPVARWDWDPRQHIQVIGIKCGPAWCEIGPTTGFATQQPPDLASAKKKLRRTRMVKGWFDEQFLARVTTNGSVVPSTIWGTIYPDSGLDDYDTLKTFTKGNWVHVADIALTDRSGTGNPPNPYKASRNLALTQTGGTLNSLYLCRGSQTDCSPQITHPCDGDGQWWARVVAADDGKARDMCDIRRSHEGLHTHVPGTARWRWLASDETTWQRCDNGCCQLK